MRLPVNSVTLIWKLTYRNWMFWASLIAGIIHLWLLFHQYIFGIYTFNIGNALVMSSFIVQGGVLVFMFYGIYLQNLESEVKLQYHLKTIEAPFLRSVAMGKFIFIVLFVITLCLLAFSFYSLLLFIRGFSVDIYFFQSLLYIGLYWGLTFLTSFGIGMLLALWIRNKSVYAISIFLSLLIGPLNSIFGHSDVLEFLNLGQSDYTYSYHALYGYSLEMYHVLKRLIIITSLVFLYILSKSILNKKIHTFFLTIVSFKLIILLFLLAVVPEQTRFSFDGNSAIYQEFAYYNKDSSPVEQQNIKIEKYDIDLDLSKELSVNLEMVVKNNEIHELEVLHLSLYHQLTVSSVKIDNTSLSFKQENDVLKLYLNKPLPSTQTFTLKMKYSGSSSPFYMANSRAVYLPANFAWLPTTTIGPAFVIENSIMHRNSMQPSHPVKYDLTVQGRNRFYTNIKETFAGKYSGENNGLTIVSGQLIEKKIGDKKVIIPSSWSLSIEGYNGLQKDIEEMLNALSQLSDEKVDMPNTIMILPVTDIYDFLMQDNYWLFNDHIILGYETNTPMPENAFELEFHQQHMVHSLVSAATWKKDNVINENLEIPILFDAIYANWYQKDKGWNIKDGYFENLLNSYQIPYGDIAIESNKNTAVIEIMNIMDNYPMKHQHDFLKLWYQSQIKTGNSDWELLAEIVNTFTEGEMKND